MSEVHIPFIHAIIIHDSEGDRLFAKYYDNRSKKEQKEFEDSLQKKTKNISSKSEEIILIENEVIVMCCGSDCKFYVVGSTDENEIILLNVLETIFSAVQNLLQGQVDKRGILDSLELILLTIDETIDSGNIMELDSNLIVSRVTMRQSESSISSSYGQASSPTPSISQSSSQMGDLSLSQAFGLARDQFFSWAGRGDY